MIVELVKSAILLCDVQHLYTTNVLYFYKTRKTSIQQMCHTSLRRAILLYNVACFQKTCNTSIPTRHTYMKHIYIYNAPIQCATLLWNMQYFYTNALFFHEKGAILLYQCAILLWNVQCFYRTCHTSMRLAMLPDKLPQNIKVTQVINAASSINNGYWSFVHQLSQLAISQLSIPLKANFAD